MKSLSAAVSIEVAILNQDEISVLQYIYLKKRLEVSWSVYNFLHLGNAFEKIAEDQEVFEKEHRFIQVCISFIYIY